MRSNAARALGAIRDRRSIEPLIEALDLESGLSRRSIVWALGELRAEAALPRLAKLYVDARNDERRGAHAGFRFSQTTVDTTLTVSVGNRAPTEQTTRERTNSVDPFLGARFQYPLAAHWTFITHGWIGGLGDSELVWQWQGLVGWNFAGNWTAFIGWRAEGADTTTGSGATRNGSIVHTNGPLLGIGVIW